MSNHIGTLQEYCQKNKYALPVYEIQNDDEGAVGISIEVNKFQYRVLVMIQNQYRVFVGGYYSNKKNAMQSAAFVAVSYINGRITNTNTNAIKIGKTDPPEKVKIAVKGTTLVLVDLENYPQMSIPDDCEYDNTRFVGFVGKCSSHAQNQHTFKDKYGFMEVIIVNSVFNDAVDHFITMYVGMNLNKYNNMIIVSRDRFVGCTMDAAQQLATGIKISHAVNSKECHDQLNSLSLSLL